LTDRCALGPNVGLQEFDLFGADLAYKATGDFELKHATHGKHLSGLVNGRAGDPGPTGLFQGDEAALRKLEQGLAHQGARYAKLRCNFLFGELGAGLELMTHDGLAERGHDLVGA